MDQIRQALKRIPGALWLVRHLRSALHPHYRAVRRAERDRPGQLLQPESTTQVGRYPQILAFVAEELSAMERPRVLSWGCSTGAELLALRKALPHAQITGVDINARSLAKARRAVRADPAIRLVLSGDPAELAGEEYDAVLCLAVVRHARLQLEWPESCAAVLPFARAESFTEGLTRLLRPGGLLALWNVHFRLADMTAASCFTPVLELERGRAANQPLYGPDNQRLDGVVCTAAVYRSNSVPSAPAQSPR